MKALKQYVTSRFKDDAAVCSVSIIANEGKYSPLMDGFDVLLLVIAEHADRSTLTHYIKDNCRIQQWRLNKPELERQIVNGGHRQKVIQWIIQGEILVDRRLYLEGQRHRLMEFPQSLREQKLFMEFNSFLKSYLQSKQYIQGGHILDAYSNILEALLHWARIVIIEQGSHPELTVWNQVRKINSGVYKLYEELTQSSETLEQRVKLVLLACEFSVMSKMEECCTVLMRIIKSRPEPWSVEELKQHSELAGLDGELGVLLGKLVRKSLLREVAAVVADDVSFIELRYTGPVQ